MASRYGPGEATPLGDRPMHPFADQFANEWAWRFEDGLNAMAQAAPTPEDFQGRIVALAERLAGHKPEMAQAWQAFVVRKLTDVTAGTTPDVGHHATRGVDSPQHEEHPLNAEEGAPPFTRQIPDRGYHIQDPAPEQPPPAEGRAPQVRLRLTSGKEIQVSERPRAPSGPVPPGWVAEPVGRWQGRETEVVYDPRRHDVMLTQQTEPFAVGADTASALEADGWERRSGDGVRD